MIKKLRNKIKKHLEGIMEIKTSPHSIAMGFALGTLIAILPTFGLGVFIGLFFVFLFERISKISLLIAFAIWNPFVLILLYPIEYSIGNYLLSGLPVKKYSLEILNTLFVYSRRFLLGSFILAVTVSIISYFLIFYATKKYQKSNLDLQKVLLISGQ